MLNIVRLAWVSSVRQPGRTSLGILGVAAVGALLFDMLLLSRGLVLSFRDLLDRAGFDVRIMASDAAPFGGPRISDAAEVAAIVGRLPQVEAVVPVDIRDVEIAHAQRGEPTEPVQFIGADPQAQPMWTLLRGSDLSAGAVSGPPLVVSEGASTRLRAAVGATLAVRGRCGADSDTVPPVVFTVVGIAEFPFESADSDTIAGPRSELGRLCGAERDDGVDMLLVRSAPVDGAAGAAAAIRAARPDLHVVTNEELVERFSRVEFSYFRQMSFVLASVTLFFGFLLIAALLTVSVNERLGEIAALRALGLSRTRVVMGVLCESVIMVGVGALLAVPIGAALSVWLDGILRALPGIPGSVHFFVFEGRALVVYGGLLAGASVGAALYPMRVVAVLPVAATLRREVVG
jgi:putative ABC transport system permease protein